MTPQPIIESRTRSKTTGQVVLTGTLDGEPFVLRLDGRMVDQATDLDYYLNSAVVRHMEQGKR